MRVGLRGSLAVVLLVGLLGVVANLVVPVGLAGAPTSSQVAKAGSAIFQAQCASCHGMGGEGTQVAPRLVGVGEASADFYLRTGRMPLSAPGQRAVRQDPVLSADQITALVAYVGSLGTGPAIPQVQDGGSVQQGWRLYQANCAACHGASGSGNAIGGGYVAANLHQADREEIAEAILIGPGQMPPFDLAPQDLSAVVTYVESLRSAPQPGGLDLGGLGPVSEGFVAIIAGLLLALLAARFVGWHRDDRGRPAAPGDDATSSAPDR